MPKRPRNPPRLRNFKCRRCYHVYQRGSQRQRVFDSKAQLVHYLDRLDTLARRYKVRIHSFSLLDNHVHFLLEPLRKHGISRLMQHLQSGHARFVHALRRTDGHLWRHHFHAKPVTTSAQYRATLLYIEQNPVAAGICQKAHQYAYSSAVAHLENQPLYAIARHEHQAQVKLYLDRWRREFDIPADGPTQWAQHLRTPNPPAPDDIPIEGQPPSPPPRSKPLPPAVARTLRPSHTPKIRQQVAGGRGS